jgi:hypothetical protein
MADFEVGQRVEADVSGTMPVLGVGSITQGTIVRDGDAPGTFLVRTDAPFNGNNLFQLTLDRLTALPS